MTTEELVTYYADLLIIQYRGKPKAYETIKALVRPILMDQLPLDVQAAFSVEGAIGVQLDVVGKYAGIARRVPTFAGFVNLSDDDYRQLIKMKIMQNNSGSSLADIQNLISIFFPDALRVFDFANMHMGYYFDSAFGSQQLAEAFVRLGLLPKPMGVQLGALIYATNLDNLFGFRTYELEGFNVTGFNSYADYQMDWPWLSYANAIVP